MVSSPRFRSPGIRSAFAIVPVPEDSSIAYHKEIYTVLFDPPSFLMVHSIVCHLWKKSKIEKKFLPLPPLPKSQPASIDFQEPLIDSISEAKEEISPSSTSVHESSTTYDPFTFRFGNFHHSILDSKPLIPSIIPEIDGSTIKIGEIICSLASEILQFNATNAQNDFTVKIDSTASKSIKRSQEFFHENDMKDQAEEDRHNDDFIGSNRMNRVISTSLKPFNTFRSGIHVPYWFVGKQNQKIADVECCINNTVLVFEIVFDPGGNTEFPSTAKVLDEYGEILRREPRFHNEGETCCVITIFDPGGNRFRN
ncbi:hypothetical protein QL285_031395 [Trifolium repens]|nr:hypothetical protein QL285_031394 [Trifolium repens]KAK2420691.1 hypothetical protein QL285_031395 [Trifolium repens]